MTNHSGTIPHLQHVQSRCTSLLRVCCGGFKGAIRFNLAAYWWWGSSGLCVPFVWFLRGWFTEFHLKKKYLCTCHSPQLSWQPHKCHLNSFCPLAFLLNMTAVCVSGNNIRFGLHPIEKGLLAVFSCAEVAMTIQRLIYFWIYCISKFDTITRFEYSWSKHSSNQRLQRGEKLSAP